MEAGLILLLLLAIYFLPSLVALGREHNNFGSIFVVNFFLGWTLVGWVVALAWALKTAPERVTIENAKDNPVAAEHQDIVEGEENKTQGLSVADEIEKLHNLKEAGILTEEEFKQKKQEMLGTKDWSRPK